MRSFFSQHSGAVLWSVLLHAAIVAALTLGIAFPSAPRQQSQGVVINATVIDAAAIREEQEKLEAQKQAEARRRQEQARAEQEKQAAAEADRKAQAEAAAKAKARAEQAAKAEAARKAKEAAELAAKQEAERKAKAEAERKVKEEAAAKAEAERKAKEEAERKAKEEAELKAKEEAERKRKEAEAREQARLDAEVQREAAEEAARLKAKQSGLEDQYVRMLRNRIEQNWNRPPSAQKGLDCWVNVTQIPSGNVINVSVDNCNGDDAVVQSIERAVQRASPLPLPPVQALFERNLRLEFKPDE